MTGECDWRFPNAPPLWQREVPTMASPKGGEGGGGRAQLTIEQLDPARIREQWRAVTGDPPPRYVSRPLLMRMLADRIQTAEYGGLSQRLKRRLLRIAASVSKGEPAVDTSPRRLTPGTVLVRDWNGTRHQVMVLESGFTYEGQTHGSLSEVARRITGTRWSGPAFFGVQGRQNRGGRG